MMVWAALALASGAGNGPDVGTEASPIRKLPVPPTPRAPVAQECPSAFKVLPGKPLPEGLYDVLPNGTIVGKCAAVAVPTSETFEAADTAIWANEVYDLARVNQVYYIAELKWRDARIVQLETALAEPVPWTDRPGVQRMAGRVEMLVAVGIGVLVVRASEI